MRKRTTGRDFHTLGQVPEGRSSEEVSTHPSPKAETGSVEPNTVKARVRLRGLSRFFLQGAEESRKGQQRVSHAPPVPHQRAVAFICIVVVALAVLAVVAAASYGYPGQRLTQDGQTLDEVALAVDYWKAHDVTGCPQGITTYDADDLLDGDQVHAAGRGMDCTIWLNAPYLAGLRSRLNRSEWRDDLLQECGIVMHEVGHALGLPHREDGGVMSVPIRTVPWECRVWAREPLGRLSAKDARTAAWRYLKGRYSSFRTPHPLSCHTLTEGTVACSTRWLEQRVIRWKADLIMTSTRSGIVPIKPRVRITTCPKSVCV